ncbi:putative periplasmic serine endoprotease DegP-like precursor [Pseudovibrio axinellae]|uniref:Probable periplasmic serine endoprotease DegP-like n=1 Tax=Pseudovibrio axinellae TaxID=989403 RepID=A0A166AFG0_9HYPH|nr:Do family serine endopeptidase [Pseudovibrio axinellae]KZL20997.1 putative periplasmic serine endoprotease DegP-like precursor [Pseudovibrio axinellae]SEP79643.1 serine protease Do [Pseudovibrio axinellae]
MKLTKNTNSNVVSLSAAKTTSKRRSRLLNGTMALAIAGAMVAPLTLVPASAQAEPVRVKAPAMPNFVGLVDAVRPTVVSVRVRSEVKEDDRMSGIPPMFRDMPEDHPLQKFFREFGIPHGESQQKKAPRKRFDQSQGSGFFISDDGFVVTNEHVVNGGTEFTIVTSEGDELEATLVGSDKRSDLALLKVEGKEKFQYVAFAEEAPLVGEWVVAVGNPFGLGGTVTSGIVSARGRDIGAGIYDDFLQIDASVNRGNSGGPAFNVKGEVVGVNSAIVSPSGGNVGIAFAIPAQTAKKIISDLKEDGSVTRGWLGVQIQPVTKDIAESLGLDSENGTLVAEVQGDTPAKAAGFQAGDIILKVNDEEVNGPRELAKVIAGYSPNTEVEITYWRNGDIDTTTVKLGAIPEEKNQASATKSKDANTALVDSLGIELATAEQAGADVEGVVVTQVDPDGPAADKGITPGSVITEVAGIKVVTPTDVAEQVEKAREQGRKAVLLRVTRGDNTLFVAIPLENGDN